jgi:hypothetical protein
MILGWPPSNFVSIFINSGHLEWKAGLSDTILKGTHPGTIPARIGLIWFSDFRGVLQLSIAALVLVKMS